MNPWPIAPITDRDLNFAVTSYDFASFTNNEQTDLPSLEGAIDSDLLDYTGSIADQATLIPQLFTALDDLFTVSNELGADDFETLFGPLSSAATGGDAILSGYQSLVGDNAGASGSGGGPAQPGTGGMSIGVASTEAVTCDTSIIWPVQGAVALPYKQTIAFQNQSGADLTVTAINAWQATPGGFSATTDVTGLIRAGATFSFDITQNLDLPNGYLFQIQISISGQPTPTNICVNVGAQPSTGGGGGATGGSPVGSRPGGPQPL